MTEGCLTGNDVEETDENGKMMKQESKLELVVSDNVSQETRTSGLGWAV